MHTTDIDRQCPLCGMQIMAYIPHECDPAKMKGWNPNGSPEYVPSAEQGGPCKCPLCRKAESMGESL